MAAAAEMGDRVSGGGRARMLRPWAAVLLGGVLLCAIPARAGVYYVTVAGLGGEPDYEQRFTALANDLDKLLKASGAECARLYAVRRRGDARAFERNAGHSCQGGQAG